MRIQTFGLTALILFIFSFTAAAQTAARPDSAQSYEITLHIMTGLKDQGSAAVLPGPLNDIAGKIRREFGVARLDLTETYFGRVSGGGSFEHKSISGMRSEAAGSPTFLDFHLKGINESIVSEGKPGFLARGFRFGSRVPMSVSRPSPAAEGQSLSGVNYQSIGVTVENLAVAENVPTLISTLNYPDANGLFLILTIKRSGN